MSAHRWYSWVIRRNRFDNVISYIKDNVSGVDKYFYPFIKKEYHTKNGVRIKDRPLYEGYLFLHYEDSPSIYHQLSACPFITTYAGTLSNEEMDTMQRAQGKLLREVKTSRFQVGENIRLLSGPFKGFEGRVTSTDGPVISVVVSLKILGREQLEMTLLEDQVERTSTLENAEVRDIGG